MTAFETLLRSQTNSRVIDSERFVPIDLSVSNPELAAVAVDDPVVFGNYVDSYLKKNNATAGYGGYNEERNLYQHVTIFNNLHNEERNIHIGLDLWLEAGTPILAALDGNVHSFHNNAGTGNYGPTIILEHQIETVVFYTLYGHLAAKSIAEIKIGDVFRQGKKLALLGNAAENGNYPPHLHFQIIKDLAGHFGDYPGVCTKSDRGYYLENCPDPNILLQLKSEKP